MLLKECRKCGEHKKKKEFSKSSDKKDGHKYNCKKCESEYWKKYYQANTEKLRSSKKIWYQENTNDILKQQSKYRKSNPDKMKVKRDKRRAQVAQATPSWLTPQQRKEICDIFAKAKKLQKQTGVKHNVDHIVPLNGKIVSGLNVPWNLQIITKADNILKSNKLK